MLVNIRAASICHTDLEVITGDLRYPLPMVLGHEAAGTVAETGAGVTRVAVGDRVAINPSHPCGACAYCRSDRENLCADMLFLGSSRRFPHAQGLFAETFATHERQCVKVPAGTPSRMAALAEPLSVVLHALSHAGPLLGRRVLVTGAVPIGALTLAAARFAGATVEITDVAPEPLTVAEALGAARTHDVAADPGSLADPAQPRGRFDAAFECSGHPAALATCLDQLAPGGTLVQVGTYADPRVALPMDRIMAKELTFKSSFRFAREFPVAVALLAGGHLNVAPVLSHEFPIADAMEAFRTASDRRKSMKVHLRF